jgi:hypothetical protein
MFRKDNEMLTRSAYIKLSIALVVTSVTLFTTNVFGQTPATSPGNLSAVQAENAAVREQMRTMEEQQKALIEKVDRLQRELGGSAPAGEATRQPIAGTQRPERYQDGIVVRQTPDTDKFLS